MRKIIDDNDCVRELNVSDLILEFQDEVRDLDSDDIDDTEYQLLTSQYSYIRFGLILDKVASRAWWKKCSEKFLDFRSFCEHKVSLNIWQVKNAIKSAQVATRLAFLGFTDLPRNASQALKMADLSLERLSEVWGNILAKCQGHKITAGAIDAEINPDKQPTSETVRLPKRVADALREQAIAAGMTLNEYLAELAFLDEEDEAIASTEQSIELNPEQLAIIDRVEYQWVKPQKFLEHTLDMFDRAITDLVGEFMPKHSVVNSTFITNHEPNR